jgi:ATP/maltotriose-dependent transcriptional regulator MalT
LFSQGRLRDVITFCRQKRKLYESYFEHPLRDLPAIALLDQAEGCALLEMNQLTEAEQCLRKGLEVGQWMPREELPGYLALARLCAAKGDEHGMAEALRRLDMRWPDIHYCTEAIRVVSALKAQPENVETRKAATKWCEFNPPEIGPEVVIPGIGPAWNDEADYAVYVAWIQLQVILGGTQEALAVIQPILDAAVIHQLNHRVIELSLLQAQAYYMQGQRERAWKPLRAALNLAENEGYLRLNDQGPVLTRLLVEAAQLGMSPNYIRRNLDSNLVDADPIIRAIKVPDNKQPANHSFDSDGLLEPLSSREIEILALMADGYSNAKIASKLFLSPNTLKSHTQNIYGKLDVHSRMQAVIKGRALKLF